MSKTWNYLRGYVIIKIEGNNLEKLINLSINRGIDIWDIKRADNLFVAKIRTSGLAKLHPLLRKTKSSVRILCKVGLPFICFRLGKRKGLVLAGIMFLAILYFLSSFVWFIEIEGNQKVDTALIKEVAEQNGLYPPVWRKKVDKQKIENALTNKIPQLAWVGINIYGTKVNIQVEEKTLVKIEKDRVECLVAKSDALIKQMLVISGQPLVKEGDTVKKGQILITGFLTSEGTTPAKGKIKGRVWYDLYREAYLKQDYQVPTGKFAKALWVRAGDKHFLLRGSSSSPFAHFTQEVKKFQPFSQYQLGWISVTYHEVRKKQKQFTLSEIEKKLRAQAWQSVARKIGKGAKIVQERIVFLPDNSEAIIPGLVRLKIEIETLEDIGRIENFYLQENRKGSQKK